MAKQKILVEDPGSADEISQEDLVKYAKLIGIDVENEKHLLWIAHEGLQACVPFPWCPIEDEGGRVYYFNQETEESIWEHPSDAQYRDLVVEERGFCRRNKSSSTTCSDPGFESKLSSLADAPPLSSVGKASASLSRDAKVSLSGKTFGSNTFDRTPDNNRLAPMKLESLNVSHSSTLDRLDSKSAVFPKGSLVKKNKNSKQDLNSNPKRIEPNVKFASSANRFVKFDIDDNSDEGSHYSYEETDYEGDDIPDVDDAIMDKFGVLDASQLSPMLSAEGSPEPMEVNSLVKLGMKFDNSLHLPERTSKAKGKAHSKIEEPIPVSSRKFEQTNVLKPITKQTESKNDSSGQLSASLASSGSVLMSNKSKGEKSPVKALGLGKEDFEISDTEAIEAEADIKEKWKARQEALEKEEQLKFDKIKDQWDQKIEAEESKLRERKDNRIKEMQEKINEDIELEETALELSLDNMKKTNANKLFEERERLDAEFKTSLQAMEKELEKQRLEMQKDLEDRRSTIVKEHQKSIEGGIVEEHNEHDHQNEEEILKNTEEVKFLESQLDNLKSLVIKEEQKLQNLTKEVSVLKKENINFKEEQKEIKTVIAEESEILKELQEERAQIQKDVDELQGEVERMENDLDLLRSEKTQLFAELSTLKDQVNKEKMLASDLRKLLDVSEVKHSEKSIQVEQTLEHKQINTEMVSKDASCQVEIYSKPVIPIVDSVKGVIADVDSVKEGSSRIQTHELTATIGKEKLQNQKNHELQQEDIPTPSASILPPQVPVYKYNDVSKPDIEEILGKVMSKFDTRMSFMENHIKSLEEKLSINNQMNVLFEQNSKEPNFQNESTNFPLPLSSEASYVNTEPRPIFTSSVHSTLPPYSAIENPGNHMNMPSDHVKACNCELGDSCEILLSLKQSLHHMHQQMHQPFLPPWLKISQRESQTENSTTLGNAEQLEDFHMKLKELRDKHRSSLLKYQFDQREMGGVPLFNTQQASPVYADEALLSNVDTTLKSREFQPYYNNWMPNSTKGFRANEDPIMRARQIISREQERSRMQNDEFMNRHAGVLYGGYPLQRSKWPSPYSSRQSTSSSVLHSSVTATPFSFESRVPPAFGSALATGFDIQFRRSSRLPNEPQQEY